MTDSDLRDLRRAADYQFGDGAGATLFPALDGIEITHTSSGRPRQAHAEDGRLVTYGTDGRYRLGLAGGRRLQESFDAPRHRVVVGDESEPFVREGRNAFAKFVKRADPGLRPGDEALVVHADGDLLAVGRAELPGEGMVDFETGMAVKVRDGADN
ncbi:pseudouridine synthase [Halomicroarcula limicola]|uniref:Pseudouridine synthase n=1 Tax=Haloarcula limicola TaxID=1429915 RepID=A0A8J7Y8D6_9EURY|nr:PUA domain-containing protein [Halomicroarcula limicola]MBV0923589.1 pseudouridine synthase [Halomicroarcula limicola]